MLSACTTPSLIPILPKDAFHHLCHPHVWHTTSTSSVAQTTPITSAIPKISNSVSPNTTAKEAQATPPSTFQSLSPTRNHSPAKPSRSNVSLSSNAGPKRKKKPSFQATTRRFAISAKAELREFNSLLHSAFITLSYPHVVNGPTGIPSLL